MSKKKTIQEVKSYFAGQGCELLEDNYVNCQTKMRYKCKCGRESTIAWSNFSQGKRCRGCSVDKNADRTKRRYESTTYLDGVPSSNHPMYWSWMSIKRRCYYKKCPMYHRYGGRGIKVCDQWKDDFISFYEWSIKNGWQFDKVGKGVKGRLSLDRIDNDGDYCPENCRWATYKDQSNNTSVNKIIEAFGESKTLKQWSEDNRSVVSVNCIAQRIERGWSSEVAITTPTQIKQYAAFGESKTLSEWTVDNRSIVNYGVLWSRINRFGWSLERAMVIPITTVEFRDRDREGRLGRL